MELLTYYKLSTNSQHGFIINKSMSVAVITLIDFNLDRIDNELGSTSKLNWVWWVKTFLSWLEIPDQEQVIGKIPNLLLVDELRSSLICRRSSRDLRFDTRAHPLCYHYLSSSCTFITPHRSYNLTTHNNYHTHLKIHSGSVGASVNEMNDDPNFIAVTNVNKVGYALPTL